MAAAGQAARLANTANFVTKPMEAEAHKVTVRRIGDPDPISCDPITDVEELISADIKYQDQLDAVNQAIDKLEEEMNRASEIATASSITASYHSAYAEGCQRRVTQVIRKAHAWTVTNSDIGKTSAELEETKDNLRALETAQVQDQLAYSEISKALSKHCAAVLEANERGGDNSDEIKTTVEHVGSLATSMNELSLGKTAGRGKDIEENCDIATRRPPKQLPPGRWRPDKRSASRSNKIGDHDARRRRTDRDTTRAPPSPVDRQRGIGSDGIGYQPQTPQQPAQVDQAPLAAPSLANDPQARPEEAIRTAVATARRAIAGCPRPAFVCCQETFEETDDRYDHNDIKFPLKNSSYLTTAPRRTGSSYQNPFVMRRVTRRDIGRSNICLAWKIPTGQTTDVRI